MPCGFRAMFDCNDFMDTLYKNLKHILNYNYHLSTQYLNQGTHTHTFVVYLFQTHVSINWSQYNFNCNKPTEMHTKGETFTDKVWKFRAEQLKFRFIAPEKLFHSFSNSNEMNGIKMDIK